MYDIFYIGNNTELKEKYPFSKQIDNADRIKSNTALYWLVESNTSITDWEIFEFKPDQYTVTYEHKWKWNDENYGGVVLVPKTGGADTVFHNKIVCKKQFDILLQETPGEYFEDNPHSSHVWCVDPQYVLGDDINWAPGNFEPDFIHSFHLRGQLEFKYPELEGGIKLYPREWSSAQFKYHKFLDTTLDYPIMYVADVDDYAQRDIHKDDYVWLIDKEHCINQTTVDWVPNPFEKEFVHCFKMHYQLKEKYPMAMGGIKLVPTNWKDAELKIHPACPIEDESYDVFYIDDDEFTSDTYNEYASRSKTDWFWVVDRDFTFNGKLLFVPAQHEQEYIHVFKVPGHLEERYPADVKDSWDIRCGGVRLVNKHFDMTKHKFQEDIVPIRYDIFYVDDLNDYATPARKSRTKMFWLIDSEHQINEEFKYVPQRYDQKYIQVFKFPGDLEHKYPRNITNISDNRAGGIKLVPINGNGESKFIDQNPVGGKTYPIRFTDDADESLTEDTWIVPTAFEDVISSIPWQPSVFEKNTQHVFAHGLLRWMPLDWNGEIREHDFSPVIIDITYEKFSSYQEGLEHSKFNWFWVVSPHVSVLEDFDWNFQPNVFDEGKAHVWQKLNPITKKQYDYGGVELRHKHEKRGRPKYVREHACTQNVYPIYVLTANDYANGLKYAYEQLASKTETNMFWVVDAFVDIDQQFDFSYYPTQYDTSVVHAWQHASTNRSSGVRLLPVDIEIINDKQIVENSFEKIKLLPEVATKDQVWSVVHLTSNTVDEINSVLDKHSGYVWTVDPGTNVDQDTIDKSFIPHVDNIPFVHVWKDADGGYGSLKLWPTNYDTSSLTDEQVSTSSITDQVIVDTVAAQQTQYPIYYLDTLDTSTGLRDVYERLASDTSSRMFWVVDAHTTVMDTFDFTFKPSQFDMDTVHVWQHAGETRNSAVRLLPTATVFKNNKQIIDNSFTKLKQVPQVASRDPVWPVVKLEELTTKEITHVLKHAETNYVWTVEPGIELDSALVERSYVPEYYHKDAVHVWKNKGTDGYGGLRLWPSDFDTSNLTDKKVATCSIPGQFILDSEAGSQKQFPVYYLTNNDYDRSLVAVYKELAENTDTRMFWVVEPNVQVNDDFDFNFMPSQFDMDVVHVWEHSGSTLTSGVKLIPTNIEFKHDKQILENNYNKLKTINSTASHDDKWPIVTLSKLNVDEVMSALSKNNSSAYVWTHDVNIDLDQSVIDDSYIPDFANRNNVHVWKNNDTEGYGGLRLWPTNYNVSSLSDEQVLTCSIPDQFILDSTAGSQKLYPVYRLTSQDIKNGLKETYQRLSDQTETRMFWVVDAFVNVNEDFDFTYAPSQFDTDVVHVWKHASTSRQTGVRLMPTDLQYDSDLQINDNSFAKLKKIATIASHDPVWPIEKFETVDVENLRSMLEKHNSADFIWTVDPDIELDETIVHQSIIPHLNNINVVHVWKRTDSEGLVVGHGGLRLWPTWFDTSSITDDQLITSSVPDQLILDSVAGPQKQFPILELNTSTDVIEQIKQFEEQCDSTMYWCVDPNVTYVDDWSFDYIPTKWEEHVVHVFLDSTDEPRSVRLIPTGTVTSGNITVKHMVNNSFDDLKVVYRHATRPTVLPVYGFNIESSINTASTKSLKQQLELFSELAEGKPFFTLDDDITVIDDFDYAHTAQLDSVDKTHVWQRLNPRTGNTHSYGGIRQWPNPPTLALKELTTDRIKMNRMDGRKLQYVKQPGCSFKEYCIVMLSYQEDIDLVEQRIQRIQQQTGSDVIHVRGIEGIFNAHKAAASKVNSSMFWVVDADAHIKDDFDFSYIPDAYDHEVVHVWASENPITGMEYGYGGVKLFNTQQVLDATSWGLDFTTGLSSRFKAMPEVSCVTQFNTDAHSTWRSAFRECVKLSMNTDDESKKRLEGWLHPVPNADFRHDAKLGAEQGVAHAKQHANNSAQLANINDFNWLWEKYNRGSE